jgi:HEAT repeat protein
MARKPLQENYTSYLRSLTGDVAKHAEAQFSDLLQYTHGSSRHLRLVLENQQPSELLLPAVTLAGRLRLRSTSKHLLKLMLSDDSDAVVRYHAAVSLGLLRSVEGEKRLLEAVKTSGSEQAVAYSVLALGIMARRRLIRPICEVLDNENRPLSARVAAAQAISFMSDSACRSVVRKSLIRGELELKAQCILALGEIGTEQDIPLLREYAVSKNATSAGDNIGELATNAIKAIASRRAETE